MSEQIVRLPLAQFGRSTGFRSDLRFTAAAEPHPLPPAEPDDPLALAWADGFAVGQAEARTEAEARAQADTAAHEALALNFARLDAELAETLRLRLRDTVAALCDAALAPLALDEAALAGRIERALALFQRAEDERFIRLHPDDIAMLSERMAAEWQVLPDPTLERGGLRIETPSGGVEDGPAQWRQAITEALL